MSLNDVAIFLLLWTVRLASGAVKTRVFIGKSRKNISIVHSLIIINRHLKRGAPSKVCLINLLLLGGIFSPEAKSLEIKAFKLAVDSVNKDYSLLRDATISGLVETAESEDEFSNMEKGTFRKTIDFLFAREFRQPCSNVDLPRRELVFWRVKILSTVTEK